MKKVFIAYGYALVTAYTMIVFVTFKPDPGEWNEFWRFLMLWVSLFPAIFAWAKLA